MVSVIVPVYKVEPFLRPCLDSILAQSFKDFELILIDDGSPDNCGVICDEYAAKDSRVRVIHQENGGLSAARNAGLDWVFANSNSQWITFVDSDDVIHTDYLFRMIQTAWKERAQVSACRLLEFDENNAPPEKYVQRQCESALVLTGHEAVLSLYSERPDVSVSACCKLYDKNLFEAVRFPVGKLHEDQAITPIVLYSSSKVAFLQDPLYYYRVRSQSIMHARFSAKRYDDVAAVDCCIAYFSAQAEPELAKAAKKKRDELIALYSLLARKDDAYTEVPKQYRISRRKALKWLRKHLSDDKYSYRLAMFYPKRLRPHAYWRKIKKTLHIPCN